jgi:hypothetical protein
MYPVAKTLLALAITAGGLAASAAEEAGIVKTSKGQVSIERTGQKLAAPVGTRIFSSDTVLTGADGAVGITLRDNTILSAGPNSVVNLDKFSFNSTTHAGAINATVKRGTLSVTSGKIAKASPSSVSFAAPGMTLGVRGTTFVIDAGQ